MSWVLLDDRLWGHPKVRALQRHGATGAAAFGLWCWSLSWCHSYSPDGVLDVDLIAADWRYKPERTRALIALLVKVGLVDESPVGFVIHDWGDWLPAGRERQRLSGLARAASARRVGGRFAPDNEPAQPAFSTSSATSLGKAGTSPANQTKQPRASGLVGSSRAPEAGGRDDGTSSEFRRRVPRPTRTSEGE